MPYITLPSFDIDIVGNDVCISIFTIPSNPRAMKAIQSAIARELTFCIDNQNLNLNTH